MLNEKEKQNFSQIVVDDPVEHSGKPPLMPNKSGPCVPKYAFSAFSISQLITNVHAVAIHFMKLREQSHPKCRIIFVFFYGVLVNYSPLIQF